MIYNYNFQWAQGPNFLLTMNQSLNVVLVKVFLNIITSYFIMLAYNARSG